MKPAGSHAGVWNAILRLGRKAIGNESSYVAGVASTASVGYDLVVHCYSNLVFNAHTVQSGFIPGATVNMYASLIEYAVPVEKRAKCWAEVTRPDASTFIVAMPEADPGQFSGQFNHSRRSLHDASAICGQDVPRTSLPERTDTDRRGVRGWRQTSADAHSVLVPSPAVPEGAGPRSRTDRKSPESWSGHGCALKVHRAPVQGQSKVAEMSSGTACRSVQTSSTKLMESKGETND